MVLVEMEPQAIHLLLVLQEPQIVEMVEEAVVILQVVGEQAVPVVQELLFLNIINNYNNNPYSATLPFYKGMP